MANFLVSQKIVMTHEGGYANDPEDSGGETYEGISRKNFPGWIGWSHIDGIKTTIPPGASDSQKANWINLSAAKSDMLQQAVLDFYKVQFWDRLALDQVGNQEIATELYDTGVNMGFGKAGMFLQRSLNAAENAGLVVDGQIGQKTLNILNSSQQPENILKVLNCLQGASYIDIIEANPKKSKYFKSWFSRVS